MEEENKSKEEELFNVAIKGKHSGDETTVSVSDDLLNLFKTLFGIGGKK